MLGDDKSFLRDAQFVRHGRGSDPSRDPAIALGTTGDECDRILKTAGHLSGAAVSRFRLDIEGMRGVAVLLVLLYHCTFTLFRGGYVGVDVFFVISGYLITRLLLDELERGNFSARNFYVRRIRRLIPALLATIALTILAGLVILSPPHLNELGVSSVFASLSLSNFHFIASSGYFETSSKIKPLLHTWSLSVEEQFYLLWPLSLWLVFRLRILRRLLFPLIAVGMVCALVLSEYWIGQNPTQAYFLLPFRAYQLLVGALAVGVERRLPSIPRSIATVTFVIGFAMLLVSALHFDESTPFPGFASAVPAFGGFLMIAAGAHAPLAGRFLGFPILTWLGRLSYSIYLAHWPIIAYAYYLSIDPFGLAEKWVLLAASLAAGLFLHHAVEANYRLSGTGHRWKEVRGVALSGVAVVLASVFLIRMQGLPQRMNLVPEKRDFAAAMEFQFLRDYRDGVLHEGTAQNNKRVLIFGDSMMQNYVPAILSLPEVKSADVTIITRGGCVAGWGALRVSHGRVDEECRALRDQVFGDAAHYDLVIWTQNWMEDPGRLYVETGTGIVPATGDGITLWRDIIPETLARLVPRAGKIVMIGPQITIEGVPLALERIGPVTDTERIKAALPQMTEIRREERDRFEEQLQAIAGKSLLIDPRAILCPREVCRLHDAQGSYFLDPLHFTAAMTPKLAARIRSELEPAMPWALRNGGCVEVPAAC
ncbi:acyltransferase family protein [Sinorhizobium meliloti]|nr:acyltransferase family protein [Sinorhizobium meliloti]MDX0278484.1 acyltransferase family protein [Sinorhizobium meliloti]